MNDIAIKLLELGQLLHERMTSRTSPRWVTEGEEWHREEKPATIEDIEKDLVAFLFDHATTPVRTIFGMDEGPALDPLVLRILCYVAYCNLLTELPCMNLMQVARAAALEDDVASLLSVRATIFRLCVRQQLVPQYGGKFYQTVYLGAPLLKFITGNGEGAPYVLSQKAVQEAWEESREEKQE